MFLLGAVTAASVDGFVMGFMINEFDLGVKNFLKAFCIIFLCCMGVTLPATMLNAIPPQHFTDLAGAALMGYLCIKAFKENEEEKPVGITAISLTVALDAAVVCVYLAIVGYNVVFVSWLSAFFHCVALWLGAKLSHRLIKNKWEIYTRYISAGIFFCMSVVKFYDFLSYIFIYPQV